MQLRQSPISSRAFLCERFEGLRRLLLLAIRLQGHRGRVLRAGGFCRLEPDLFKIFVTENDDDNQRGSGNDIVAILLPQLLHPLSSQLFFDLSE